MANGRAERMVGELKRMMRRLLHSSGMPVVWWPMAMRYLMEAERLRGRDEKVRLPGFGAKVLVKKRNWTTKAMEATHHEAKYLSPMIEGHGHCVLKEDGRWGISPHIIQNVREPPPPTEEMWLMVADEEDRDEAQERQRLRGKGPIRRGGDEGLLRIRRMIQEEAVNIEGDTVTNAMLMFKRMEPWKKMMRKMEHQEEEVLQTKIVSPQELVRDLELWDEPIQSEMRSLLDEKKAIRRASRREVEESENGGAKVVIVPSK